jgi:Bacterial TSP3 repeat
VSASTQGGAGNGPSTKPVLAANGRTVVFQSFASDLVAGDFNDRRDLFVLTLGDVDSEPDGMDDDWEVAFFGNLSHDGTADTDGDGATDLQEFLAGTDPTNANSVFRVLTIQSAGGGTKTLLWSGNSTRSYRAEFKDDLTVATWTALTGTISWNGTTASISDPTAGSATNRYYRVLRLP